MENQPDKTDVAGAGFLLAPLPPHVVLEHWASLREGVASVLPEHVAPEITDQTLNGLLENIMAERMTFWAGGVDKQPLLFLITQVVREGISGTANLWIMCLRAVRHLDADVVAKGLQILKGYAKVNGCSSITALTDSDRVREFMQSAGATSSTYLRLEVS